MQFGDYTLINKLLIVRALSKSPTVQTAFIAESWGLQVAHPMLTKGYLQKPLYVL